MALMKMLCMCVNATRVVMLIEMPVIAVCARTIAHVHVCVSACLNHD